MSVHVSRLLHDSLTTEPRRTSHHSNLVHYLDEHLIFLKDKLVSANFDRAIAAVWNCCLNTISSASQSAISSRQPAPYFGRLHNTIRVMVSFFYGEDTSKVEDEQLLRIARLVRLYACNARTLTHLYYLARHAEQTAVPLDRLPHGSVTMRALLQQRHLRVELLNARHLRPVDVITRTTVGAAAAASSTVNRRRTSHPKYNDSVTSSTTAGSSGVSTASSSYDESLSSGSPYGTYPRRVRGRSKSVSVDSGSSNQGDQSSSSCAGDSGVVGADLTLRRRLTLQREGSEGDLASAAAASAAKMSFLKDKLDNVRLSVQSAHVNVHRTLAPLGRCNPYVTIRVVQASAVNSQSDVARVKARTKTQLRTLFPL